MEIRIISFDFDLTLSRGVTAIEHFAGRHGQSDYICEMERRFRTEGLTTRAFSDLTAHLFAGMTLAQLEHTMSDIPLLDDVEDVFAFLRARGHSIIINSVGYSVLIPSCLQKFGADGVSGAELHAESGVLSGRVARYADESAKIEFAAAHARALGCRLENVLAVGDSRSDIPLFKAVGGSVALNGDQGARETATHSLSTDSLWPVARYVEQLSPTIEGGR